MNISYRQVRDWVGAKSFPRRRAPFKVSAFKALAHLQRELQLIEARDVAIYAYFRDKDFNRSGGIYADARPTEPGVILEYLVGATRYRLPCDTYVDWFDNVRAIGLTLENLRAIDRYGVTKGEQYEGFKALPERTTETLSRADAMAVIAIHARTSVDELRRDGEALVRAIRLAKRNTHPDFPGGSHDAALAVQRAEAALLEGAAV